MDRLRLKVCEQSEKRQECLKQDPKCSLEFVRRMCSWWLGEATSFSSMTKLLGGGVTLSPESDKAI